MKKYLLLLLLPMSVFAASENYFCPTQGSLSFIEDPVGTCYGSNGGKCHRATPGQSWDGIVNNKSKDIQPSNASKTANKVKCIVIKADRKYSTSVLEWVNKNSEVGSNENNSLASIRLFTPATEACNTNCAPKDLNLAAKGTLQISGLSTLDKDEIINCPGVILAQGSFTYPGSAFGGSRQNTNWIISSYGSFTPQPYSLTLSCKVANSNQYVNVQVYRIDGRDSTIAYGFQVL